jgi:hypothetical protein
MISLVTAGLLDTSFLVPMQVFQTWILILVRASWDAAHAPIRLAWDDSVDGFVPYCDMVQGVVA